MTTAPISAVPAAAPRPAGLGRRVTEFLLVGGVTPLLFGLSWLLRESLGLSVAEYWTGFTFFYAAHLLNDPHFAVTYLLFYRDGRARAFGDRFGRAQRMRYLAAGVLAPLALGGWAVYALARGSAPMLGLMFQLMYLLVGWHYTKQGFGVAMVLARGAAFASRRSSGGCCSRTATPAGPTRGPAPYDPGASGGGERRLLRELGQPTWLEPLTLGRLRARQAGARPGARPQAAAGRAAPAGDTAHRPPVRRLGLVVSQRSTRWSATRCPRCTSFNICTSSVSCAETRRASGSGSPGSRPRPERASRCWR